MSDEPKKQRWLRWFWAVLCVLLAIYVGGYFRLAQHPLFEGAPVDRVRIYPWQAIKRAYLPLAWIDARLSNRVVVLKTPEDDYVSDWIIVDPDP
jgi:hypothetical protein